MSQLTWDLIDSETKQSLLSFQSFIDFQSKAISKTTSQPVEEGGFAMVNKVVSPNEYSVTLALQGTELELGQAENILKQELCKASLLQILTPNGLSPKSTLISKNITRKTENGLGVLYAELAFQEIREIKPSSINTIITQAMAKRPSDVSQTDGGLVQGKEPNGSVASKIKKVVG